MNIEDSLQAYFEQQNDKEAASIVAAVMALLPSNTSVISWNDEKEQEDNSMNAAADNVLNNNNFLLTKESEIAALKEVIVKWRNRAFDAESNARIYYLEQLQLIELQHENELRAMESRYQRKLYEKDDIISTLRDQVDYLICKKDQAEDGDTESFVSTIDYSEDADEERDSVYDRDAEQGLVVVENKPATELKSETILDNIQVTMRAIEQELSFHHSTKEMDLATQTRRHRRSPTYTSANTYFSSSTLIEAESATNKKIKKSSFFLNRIFKKAFPKLYKKPHNTNINTNTMNLKYSKSLPSNPYQLKKRNFHHHSQRNSSVFFDDSTSFPRSSTDETLGVYSTTNSTDCQKPVNVMDLLPAMNNNMVLV
ncbi:uncharacterized protein EV154DRAFT_492473 [Mucor mucedo]|uniref:uncharacterized protein n=1 Tax=Mucor mucedo TaxID=29922 RepID=UPI00221FB046|nr:uncharacterized protein EV154DRAFT_492473 [Mucor mucedo]KAI7896493.1 hypothetical protein EV154DRAFT_492473 [Mucor mucedo]